MTIMIHGTSDLRAVRFMVIMIIKVAELHDRLVANVDENKSSFDYTYSSRRGEGGQMIF